jgi:hypothetical protein
MNPQLVNFGLPTTGQYSAAVDTAANQYVGGDRHLVGDSSDVPCSLPKGAPHRV